MIPSRYEALKGIDYEPKEQKEIQAKQKHQLEQRDNVKVEMWRMDAGIYTQVRVTYRGTPVILVVSDNAPSRDPEELAIAVKKFYEYYDLGKTAILKKASSNDKKPIPHDLTEQKTHIAYDIENGQKGKKHYYNRRPKEDENLIKIGMDCNNPIYKERVIQIFSFAEKKAKKEYLPVIERNTFTSKEIYDNVFRQIYENSSETTIRNKVAATLRFMAKEEWLSAKTTKTKLVHYSIKYNPYEDEMPAQAEFDTEDQKKQMASDLSAMRRNEDGLKC